MDIRAIVENAPPDASAKLRTVAAWPAFWTLNHRLPVAERVLAMVYSVDSLSYAKGYLVLTDSRLIYAVKPETADVDIIAVPFADITQFAFDSGMAVIEFGPSRRKLYPGFPACGHYPRDVCEHIRSTLKNSRPDQYRL